MKTNCCVGFVRAKKNDRYLKKGKIYYIRFDFGDRYEIVVQGVRREFSIDKFEKVAPDEVFEVVRLVELELLASMIEDMKDSITDYQDDIRRGKIPVGEYHVMRGRLEELKRWKQLTTEVFEEVLAMKSPDEEEAEKEKELSELWLQEPCTYPDVEE